MKYYSRNIVISALSLLLLGGFLYLNTVKEHTQFVQKKPNKLKKAQRIDGAIEFWKQIRNNGVTGEIPHGAYQRAFEQMNAYSRTNKTSAFNINWENIGPTNMAGRVRGIMVDPDNPNRVYAGSVSGGLYRSDNSGDNWYPVHVPEENSNHAITWIAKDPATKIYYYGTGEYRFDVVTIGPGTPDMSIFRGNGLYKSTDGQNFEWIPSTNPNTTVTTDPWYAAYVVYRVLCHPDSVGVIYAATNRGLLRSGDGGTTWTTMTVRLPSTTAQTLSVTDIEYKKGDSVLYFTVRYSGSVCRLNKINYNTKQLYETNLPNSTANCGRTEIALSDDKRTIYAITVSSSTWDHTGIYRHTDGGNGASSTWQQIGPASTAAFDIMGPNNQGFYDVSFEVSPKQQDSTEILYVGGIDLWRWNLIRGWEKISQWSIPNVYWNDPKSFGFKYEYIHADQHIVTFNPSNPNQMFVGCDGGVFRSNNRGYNFTYVPNNFVTFQFYDIDVAPDGSVLGGTQDNGSNLRTNNGNNSTNKATELVGGDGFDQYASKKKPSTGLVTQYNGALYRFAINPATGTISAGPFYDLNIDKTGPSSGPDGLPDDGVGFKWDLICHEPHQYNGDSAYTIIGTSKALWITDGNTFNLGKIPKWKKMTPNTGAKAITNASCFSIPVDADSVLYVGTVGGNVYRIKYFYSGDSVKISNSITRIFTSSGRYITGVAANPKNPEELYITLGEWQGGTSAAYVVKITDAATRTTVATVGSGATQLNAAGGTNGFPQCPAYCVEVNRYNTNQVFVGSELGVFASEDGGNNWVSLNDFNGNTRPNGLPRVPVLSMKPQYYSAYVTIGANNVAQYVFTGETDYLYLGTHGRGWYKTTSRINSIGKDKVEQNTINLNVYPNPVSDNLTLTFDNKNPANVNLQIIGLDGKVVKSTPYNAHTGMNTLQLNMANIPTGIYLVRMTGTDNKGNAINMTRKVSVIH